MRTLRTLLTLLLAGLLVAACNWTLRPYEGTYDQVLIYYGMGYNNLSSNLRENLRELQQDALPGLHNDKAIVAFIHNVASSGNYSTPNAPALIRIYRALDGTPVMDTLRRYDDMAVSAAPESMRRVLGDIRDAFPARRYGMIISSHGTGWLPGGYSRNTTPRAAALQEGGRTDGQDDGSDGQGGSAGSSREIYGPEGIWPPTKAIGNQYTASSRIHWMEVGALAGAIPFHLEYLIIDACLSGAVEIAWELRDVSDRLVVSPAEILTAGMGYSNLSWDMLASGTPDLERYCREYYEHYNGQSGSYRSGTIALVESARLPALADAFAAVLDAHRDALDHNKLSASVQRYYYGTSPLIFFYDLRDFAAQLGASPDELARLDAALGAAVPVHYETPTFFDLPLERCCGLSVYIPDPSRPTLNDYYRALGWNRAVGLVQ